MFNHRATFVSNIIIPVSDIIAFRLRSNKPVVAPSVLIALATLDSDHGTNDYCKRTGNVFYNIPSLVDRLKCKTIGEQAGIVNDYFISHYFKGKSCFSVNDIIVELKHNSYKVGEMFYQKITNTIERYNLVAVDRAVFDTI